MSDYEGSAYDTTIEQLEGDIAALREALEKIGRSGDRERNVDGSLVTAQQIARDALTLTDGQGDTA